MKCPNCGTTDGFAILVTTWMNWYDNGRDLSVGAEDLAYIEPGQFTEVICKECQYQNTHDRFNATEVAE
jgi:predicted nucleic-acid-binding Zn-ribbon protein